MGGRAGWGGAGQTAGTGHRGGELHAGPCLFCAVIPPAVHVDDAPVSLYCAYWGLDLL